MLTRDPPLLLQAEGALVLLSLPTKLVHWGLSQSPYVESAVSVTSLLGRRLRRVA
jgi:hypothetical protein